ncbi:ATP-binding protein [Amaricoccus tamworthensis]|uniref:ATP-binding protein n=1 Tax=Amaricoccus tamworthensis TaxID=57002 RepID=UPI003C7D9A22
MTGTTGELLHIGRLKDEMPENTLPPSGPALGKTDRSKALIRSHRFRVTLATCLTAGLIAAQLGVIVLGNASQQRLTNIVDLASEQRKRWVEIDERYRFVGQRVTDRPDSPGAFVRVLEDIRYDVEQAEKRGAELADLIDRSGPMIDVIEPSTYERDALVTTGPPESAIRWIKNRLADRSTAVLLTDMRLRQFVSQTDLRRSSFLRNASAAQQALTNLKERGLRTIGTLTVSFSVLAVGLIAATWLLLLLPGLRKLRRAAAIEERDRLQHEGHQEALAAITADFTGRKLSIGEICERCTEVLATRLRADRVQIVIHSIGFGKEKIDFTHTRSSTDLPDDPEIHEIVSGNGEIGEIRVWGPRVPTSAPTHAPLIASLANIIALSHTETEILESNALCRRGLFEAGHIIISFDKNGTKIFQSAPFDILPDTVQDAGQFVRHLRPWCMNHDGLVYSAFGLAQLDGQEIRTPDNRLFRVIARRTDTEGWLVVLTDTTERWELNNQKNQATALIQAAFFGTRDAVCVVTRNLNIRNANAAFYRLVGAGKSASANKPVDVALAAATDFERTPNLTHQRLRDFLTMQINEPELRLELKTNLSVIARVVRTDTGDLMLFLTDITRIISLEQDALQNRKLSEIGQIASGVAHDFNNVLFALGGNIDAIETSVGPDALREVEPHIHSSRQVIGRAAALTSSLLSYSRRQVLTPETISASRLHSAISARIEVPDNINLALDIRSEMAIHADMRYLMSALQQLARNSVEAIDSRDGRIEIVVTDAVDTPSDSPMVRIRIRDTGGGIHENILPHIFTPFYSTKSNGHGTGLGLSMAMGFVEQSGGRITVRNWMRGAEFSVFLPAKDVARAPVQPEDDTGTLLLPGSKQLHRPVRCLLLEDDADCARVFGALLSKHGFDVVHCASNLEAAEKLDAGFAPEFMISDWSLPDGNSSETIKRVIADHAGVRILLVSGYITEDLGNFCRSYGVESANKPVTLEHILACYRGDRPGTAPVPFPTGDRPRRNRQFNGESPGLENAVSLDDYR